MVIIDGLSKNALGLQVPDLERYSRRKDVPPLSKLETLSEVELGLSPCTNVCLSTPHRHGAASVTDVRFFLPCCPQLRSGCHGWRPWKQKSMKD